MCRECNIYTSTASRFSQASSSSCCCLDLLFRSCSQRTYYPTYFTSPPLVWTVKSLRFCRVTAEWWARYRHGTTQKPNCGANDMNKVSTKIQQKNSAHLRSECLQEECVVFVPQEVRGKCSPDLSRRGGLWQEEALCCPLPPWCHVGASVLPALSSWTSLSGHKVVVCDAAGLGVHPIPGKCRGGVAHVNT